MLVRLQLVLDIIYSGVSLKSLGPQLVLPPLKLLSGLEPPQSSIIPVVWRRRPTHDILLAKRGGISQ